MSDRSNGYESIAEAFINARRASIGPTIVRSEGLMAVELVESQHQFE